MRCGLKFAFVDHEAGAVAHHIGDMRILLAVRLDGDREGFAEVAFRLAPAAVICVQVGKIEKHGAGVFALRTFSGLQDGERATKATVGVAQVVETLVQKAERVERKADPAIIWAKGGCGNLECLLRHGNSLINLPLLAELFGLLRQLRPALFLRRGERHRKKENN